MAQYFFKVNQSYSQKNKLYEAFNAVVRSYDSTLLRSNSEKNDFKRMLRSQLTLTNKKYSRCKPLELKIHQWSLDKTEEDIRVDSSFVATIYQVKKEFINTGSDGEE